MPSNNCASRQADAELIASRGRIFKALSDGTRLEIMEFLKDGERCVCEIIPSIGKAQSTTSKNLDILFRAGSSKGGQLVLRLMEEIKKEYGDRVEVEVLKGLTER